METVKLVYDTALNMATQLFNACMRSWDIFGTFVVFMALIRVISRIFNKTKND